MHMKLSANIFHIIHYILLEYLVKKRIHIKDYPIIKKDLLLGLQGTNSTLISPIKLRIPNQVQQKNYVLQKKLQYPFP